MPDRIRWLSLNSDAFIGLGSLALRFSAMGIVVGAITDASGIPATAGEESPLRAIPSHCLCQSEHREAQ